MITIIKNYIEYTIYLFMIIFKDYLIGYNLFIEYNGSNFNYLKHTLSNNLKYIKYAIFHNKKTIDDNDFIIINWKIKKYKTKENPQQHYINNYHKFDFDYEKKMD